MPLILGLIVWELTRALLPTALTAEAGGTPPLSEDWDIPSGSHSGCSRGRSFGARGTVSRAV